MYKNSSKQEALEALYKPYRACVACPLGKLGRTQVVFGSGDPDARIMLIGEAPGEQEDKKGIPFVGRSGALLTQTLNTIGINRSDIFIANIIKCRPPLNRTPVLSEMKICKNLLLIKQIEIINPQVICTLGAAPLQGILERPVQITLERGAAINVYNTILIPTLHPAYILRNPSKLDLLIADLLLVKKISEQI